MTYTRLVSLLLILHNVLAWTNSYRLPGSFTSSSHRYCSFLCKWSQVRISSPRTCLSMAKSKTRSKQAELRDKLAKAKQEKLSGGAADSASSNDATLLKLSAEEIKEQNDRRRFEQLLRSQGGSVLNDFSKDGYLSQQQEEEEIIAKISGVERIFEGDPAPTDCFDELVSITTEDAAKAADLIPWKHKNPHRRDDYLVIVCDPRPESPELRATVKSLLTEVPADILKRLVIVNADSPAKNRRWLKKDGMEFSKVNVYSDEKMEFMRAYTALGDTRWSMTTFVIADERVQKVARDVDRYGAAKTIRYAVKALTDKRV
ncbi:hypothetical protein MPSEU_000862300 [Mayamaea pseudoterrestris]|nr:hypothetical protein MPSEU_000862300 [Mayamaea pseudoterrestris]